MADYVGTCFVIMPFTRSELHYFYLYLKQYLYDKYHLQCIRADELGSSGLLLDKIKAAIKSADLVIAECTGERPNVYFELGIAYALDKHIILLLQQGHERPSDLQGHHWVMYNIEKDAEFFEEFDQRLQNFLARYELLYEAAVGLFNRFKLARNIPIVMKNKAEFITSLKISEETQPLPPTDANDRVLALALLLKLIENGENPSTVSAVFQWIETLA